MRLLHRIPVEENHSLDSIKRIEMDHISDFPESLAKETHPSALNWVTQTPPSALLNASP
jgi:hypothetical protein